MTPNTRRCWIGLLFLRGLRFVTCSRHVGERRTGFAYPQRVTLNKCLFLQVNPPIFVRVLSGHCSRFNTNGVRINCMFEHYEDEFQTANDENLIFEALP